MSVAVRHDATAPRRVLGITAATVLCWVAGSCFAVASPPARVHPLAGIPAGLDASAWERAADRAAWEWLTTSPVTLRPMPAAPRHLRYGFAVGRQPSEPVASFALALPPGEITTASLDTAFTIDAEERATPLPQSGDSATSPAGFDLKVEPLGYIRTCPVVRVTVALRSNAAPGRLLSGGEITLAAAAWPVDSAGAGPNGNGQTRFGNDGESTGPMRDGLRLLVANPAQLDAIAALTPAAGCPSADPRLAPPAWSPPVTTGTAYPAAVAVRVPITTGGLVAVSAAELTGAGMAPAAVRPDRLRVLVDGVEKPCMAVKGPVDMGTTGTAAKVSGQASGWASGWDTGSMLDGPTPLAPADRIVFFARASESPFSTVNMHWIVSDPNTAVPPLRFPPFAAPIRPDPSDGITTWVMAAATVEEDNSPVLVQTDQFLTILGYRWAWWTWTGRSGTGGTVPAPRPWSDAGRADFDLPGLADQASANTTATVAFEFYFASRPPGARPVRLAWSVNGTTGTVLDIRDEAAAMVTAAIAPGVLKGTSNTFVLVPLADDGTTLPESARAGGDHPGGVRPELAFDKATVTYPRALRAAAGGLRFRSSNSHDDHASSATATRTRDRRYAILQAESMSRPLALDVTAGNDPRAIIPVVGPDGALGFRARESAARDYEIHDVDRLPSPALSPAPADRPDLRSTSNCADLLIVAHQDFLADLAPFAAARRAGGHGVALIDVRDVYDQFAAGQETPWAIRRLVRHAATAWRPAAGGPSASALLLVGDCTSAYRDEFRNGVGNLVPTFVDPAAPRDNRPASDSWFGCVSGPDPLGDVAVGRISVRTPDELRTILAKIAVRESGETTGPWRRTVGIVADHSDFEEAADRVTRDSIAPWLDLRRIDMAAEPWVDNYYFPPEIAAAKKSKVSPAATAKVRDLFNGGAALVAYFGHGSPNIWSNERLWFGGGSENSDNLMLRNGPRLPIVLNYSCNTGAIDYPKDKWTTCISEDMMRQPAGGAVACIVPTGTGVTGQHERLATHLHRALTDGRTGTLGMATQLAHWRYLLEGNPPDLAKMYVLLGDPTMALDRAPGGLGDGGAGLLSANARVSGATGRMNVRMEPRAPGFRLTATWTGPRPARGVTIRLSGAPAGVAAGVRPSEFEPIAAGDFLPGESRVLDWNIPPETTAALWLLDAASTAADGVPLETGLSPDDPMPLAAVIPVVKASAARGSSGAPRRLAADPRTLATRWTRSGGSGPWQAVVTARAYNLTGDAVGDGLATLAEVGEAGPALLVAPGVSETTSPIPSARAGGWASIELRRDFDAPSTSSVRFGLWIDERLATMDPDMSLDLGAASLPDLRIAPEGIVVSDRSPTEGETVFFDATVENVGGSVAEDVRLSGRDLGTTAPGGGPAGAPVAPMESRISRIAPLTRLAPGTSTTMRLRWDPARESGPRRVAIEVTGRDGIDRDPSDNVRTIDLRVRTKAALARGPAYGVKPTDDDRRLGQLRFRTAVFNKGETDAQGVRVAFFSPTPTDPRGYLGETILESVPAKSRRDAFFAYRPRPADRNRLFSAASEVALKGSLQRAPLDPAAREGAGK